MAQEVFQRYEKKYLLSKEQYRQIMLRFGGILELDRYGRHRIGNIYLDTPDYRLIRTSLEKPVYKEKVRLRGYGEFWEMDGRVFLELKKKYDHVVYKRRIEMEYEEAWQYLYGGIRPERQDQIFQELDFCIGKYGLKPMAYIAYERMAYTCSGDSGLRVTFDQDILGRSDDLELTYGAYGKCLLDPGQVLMEIKVPGAVPLWMSQTFSELGIFPTSYSKYGRFYRSEQRPDAHELQRTVCVPGDRAARGRERAA